MVDSNIICPNEFLFWVVTDAANSHNSWTFLVWANTLVYLLQIDKTNGVQNQSIVCKTLWARYFWF